MGLLELIGALLSILAAVVPTLVAHYVEVSNAKKGAAYALAKLESDDTDVARAHIAELRRLRLLPPAPGNQ